MENEKTTPTVSLYGNRNPFLLVLPRVALVLGVINILMGVFAIYLGRRNGFNWSYLIEPGSVLAISFALVGTLVASYKPLNIMGWIYLAIGFSQGLASFAFQYAYFTYITISGSLPFGHAMSVLGQIAWLPGFSLLTTYALQLFPTGKPISRGWRVLAWLSLTPLLFFVISIFTMWPAGGRELVLHPEQAAGAIELPPIVMNTFFPFVLLLGVASVISLFVRLHRASGIERQQLKIFTYAAAVTLAEITISNYLLNLANPSILPILYLISVPFVILIPAAAGVAILRYRLWDIDIIIRKTLVYGALTLTLALVYFGSVVLLQSLVTAAGGQQSTVITVISTLLIAALFTPLRRRIQNDIDRRFYRKKYDAEKTVASFSAGLRQEVDLEQIGERLLFVVEETMQPDQVSLWLKKDKK